MKLIKYIIIITVLGSFFSCGPRRYKCGPYRKCDIQKPIFEKIEVNKTDVV